MELLRKYLRGIVLSLVFGAVVFIALSFWSGFREVVQELKKFNWWIAPLVLILACCNYLVRFYKFHFYVRTLGIKIKKSDSFAVFIAGLVMSVTPGKFGEVLKSVLIKAINGTPISKSAPIVLAERFTDFVALAMMSSLGLLYYDFGLGTYIASAVLIFGPLLLVGSPKVSHALIGLLAKIPALARIVPKMQVAYESIAVLLKMRYLLWTTVISVLSWFFECIGFYLVCNGFGSTPVELLGVTFVYCFSILVGALSMLPGGLGMTEGSLNLFLVNSMGMLLPVAVASTFIVRAGTIWFAVMLGAVTLVLCQKRFQAEASSEVQ